MKKFEKPNLPVNGSILICDKSVTLSEKFKHFIPTAEIPVLPPSMRYHADLQICYIGDGVFLSAPETYEYYSKMLTPTGAEVLCGERRIGSTYGDDCAYNILIIGKTAFHNTKYTPDAAIDFFKKNNIRLIHVNQGYSKCAVAPISESCAITADISIKKAMDTIGTECLLIDWKGVSLPGFSYGFFGGCSARLSKNTFFVNGSLKNHPSKDKITNFLEKHNMTLIENGNNIPLDVGSFIIA